jgi:hypothetical protein
MYNPTINLIVLHLEATKEAGPLRHGATDNVTEIGSIRNPILHVTMTIMSQLYCILQSIQPNQWHVIYSC